MPERTAVFCLFILFCAVPQASAHYLWVVVENNGDDGSVANVIFELWKGESAANRLVHIRGPERFQQNVRTDERGRVVFEPSAPGRYTFRTSVELTTPGRDDGDAYELIRHHATLVMRLPLGG